MLGSIGAIRRAYKPNLGVGPDIWKFANTTAVWAVANQLIVSAFTVDSPVVVTTANFRIGVASGNMDVAILDATFTRLASCGSFAVPASGVSKTQVFAASASVALVPGIVYYSGVNVDNTTATLLGYSFTGMPAIASHIRNGFLASAVPIPAGPLAPAEIAAATLVPFVLFT